MILRSSIRIGIQPGTKALRIERNPFGSRPISSFVATSLEDEDGNLQPKDIVTSYEHGSWCIWINANRDFTQGTYLKLYDDGAVERVTLHADGSETVGTIKPSD